jgi:hydrogenase nickel incorporation protein HypB
MCGICGCGDANVVSLTDPDTGLQTNLRGGDAAHTHADGTTHVHSHDERHGHIHAHDVTYDDRAGDLVLPDEPHMRTPETRMVTLEMAVLAKNDQIAARNRGWFEGRGVVALNLVSSPGAGKTALLERTIRDLGGEIEISVIEGDQMTANDARRIRAAGGRAVQVNTGSGCHLEADMVAGAVKLLDPKPGSLLLIENVGNLVCPAMFDLGERFKIAVTSVTEGEDKPLKYPFMFRAAEVVILNKIDLAPHVDFDHEAWLGNLRATNQQARVFLLSARTGDGMMAWYDLLRTELRADI